MKKTFLLYFGVSMLICLNACTDEKSSVQIDQSITSSELDTSHYEEIKKVALSFHKSYIAAVNDNHTSDWSPDIVEDSKGFCAFDFFDYFDALRKLGTISEKFIESERERVSDCEEFMKTIRYDEYISSEAYAFQDKCSSFYYMHWLRSQEPFTGIEVDEIIENHGIPKVKLIFYDDFQGKKEYLRSNQPIVSLIQENKVWKITKIDWAE